MSIISSLLFSFRYIGAPFQEEAPGEVFAPDGVVYVFPFCNFQGPGAFFSCFHVEGISGKVHAVIGHVDAQGLGEAAGAAGEEFFFCLVPSFFHKVQSFQRFQGADEDGAGLAFVAADKVEAGVHAVDEVDVGMAAFSENDSGPGSEAFEYVGAVVFMALVCFAVGFAFHDAAGGDAFGGF